MALLQDGCGSEGCPARHTGTLSGHFQKVAIIHSVN